MSESVHPFGGRGPGPTAVPTDTYESGAERDLTTRVVRRTVVSTVYVRRIHRVPAVGRNSISRTRSSADVLGPFDRAVQSPADHSIFDISTRILQPCLYEPDAANEDGASVAIENDDDPVSSFDEATNANAGLTCGPIAIPPIWAGLPYSTTASPIALAARIDRTICTPAVCPADASAGSTPRQCHYYSTTWRCSGDSKEGRTDRLIVPRWTVRERSRPWSEHDSVRRGSMTLKLSSDESRKDLEESRFLVSRCPTCRSDSVPSRSPRSDGDGDAETGAVAERVESPSQHRTASDFETPLVTGLVECNGRLHALARIDTEHDPPTVGDIAEFCPTHVTSDSEVPGGDSAFRGFVSVTRMSTFAPSTIPHRSTTSRFSWPFSGPAGVDVLPSRVGRTEHDGSVESWLVLRTTFRSSSTREQ